MKGTIRMIVGCLLMLGGIGGMDNAISLWIPVLSAICGFVITYWGHRAQKIQQNQLYSKYIK